MNRVLPTLRQSRQGPHPKKGFRGLVCISFAVPEPELVEFSLVLWGMKEKKPGIHACPFVLSLTCPSQVIGLCLSYAQSLVVCVGEEVGRIEEEG